MEPSPTNEPKLQAPHENEKQIKISSPERASLFGRVKKSVARLIGIKGPKKTTKNEPTVPDYSKFIITKSKQPKLGTDPYIGPLDERQFATKESTDPDPVFAKDLELVVPSSRRVVGGNTAENAQSTPVGTLIEWDPTKFTGENLQKEVPNLKADTRVATKDDELHRDGQNYTTHVPFHRDQPKPTSRKSLLKKFLGFGTQTHERTPLPIKNDPTFEQGGPSLPTAAQEAPFGIESYNEEINRPFEITLATDGDPLVPSTLEEVTAPIIQELTPNVLRNEAVDPNAIETKPNKSFEKLKGNLEKFGKKQDEGLLSRKFKNLFSRMGRVGEDVWEGTKEASFAYKNLPWTQKAIISTGLIGLGLASGTAAIPALTGIAMRAIGFIGAYTAYIKIAEQKLKEKGGGSLDLKQHGAAAALAGLIALTVPEMFRFAGEALSPILSQTIHPIMEKAAELINPAIDQLKEAVKSYHYRAPIGGDYKLPEATTEWVPTEATGTGVTEPVKQVMAETTPGPVEQSAVPMGQGGSLYGNTDPNLFPSEQTSPVALNHTPIIDQAAPVAPVAPSPSASAPITSTTPSPSHAPTPHDIAMGHQVLPNLSMSHVISKGDTLTSVISDTSHFRELADLTKEQRDRAVGNIIAKIDPATLHLPDNLWLTAGKSLDLTHIHDIIKNSTINGESIISYVKSAKS